MPIEDKRVQLNFKATFQELFDRGRFNIGQFARDFLDVDPNPKQEIWFKTEPWSVERMLIGGNRSGKTLSAAVKHLHGLLYQTRNPKYAKMTHRYIRVNLSLTLDMAGIAFQWALNRALDSPLYRQFVLEDQVRNNPFPVLVVGSGKRGKDSFRSELWARSSSKGAKYLLGKDIDQVTYDEAAFDPQGAQVVEEVLLMRLADRAGLIDYVSTPNGKNWAYERYLLTQQKPELQKPSHYYFGMTISSYDNKHVDQDRLKTNEQRMSDAMRQQNIDGLFIDVNGMFNGDSIEKCYLKNDWSLPVPPVRDAVYLKAFDFGFRVDPTVGLIARVDVTPAELVFADEWGGLGSGKGFVGEGGIYEEVVKLHHLYPGPIYGDSTGPGGKLILDALVREYGVPMQESDVAGQRGEAKKSLILAGKQALEGRRIIFPLVDKTKPLVNELRFYQLKDENIATDYVMAFCILAEGMRKESYIEEDVPAEPAVWATKDTILEGECNCILTNDLTYCLRHHNIIRDSICCGGEKDLVIAPRQQGDYWILDDMALEMNSL